MIGKGLDVGTANLVCAEENDDGEITIRAQRNAFIDVKADAYAKKMLTDMNVQYVVHGGNMCILGESAFEMANILNKNTRRPMRNGVISNNEVDALPMIKLIVEHVVGKPKVENEVVYFSVPGDPIDADMNIIYHKGIFEGVLRKLGYMPKAMQEGHSVVFSELADQDFTGIGISCGGGMFNVSVSYRAMPALTFSTTRGGDWIDQNVAQVCGIKQSKATLVKERGVDMTNPKDREEEAVVIYYRNLINYTLTNIKHRFETGEGMPNFPDPIDIVCAGGTSLIGGFAEVFQDEFDNIDFPIEVKSIRRAEDPLNSIAKGCLVAALNEAEDEE